MSDYRDRLLGFLKSHAPAAREDLYAGEIASAPSSVPRGDDDLRHRFQVELEAVGGEVIDLTREDDPSAVLSRWLAGIESGTAAVDADPAWSRVSIPLRDLLGASNLEVREVDGTTTSRELADVELGVTIAEAAISETGTIAQCARPFRPRSLSLVPPRHLVLVPADRLLAGMEELFAGVAQAPDRSGGSTGFGAYFTWITGPSRTADIEKTLTIGIHGPGSLTVLLLSDEVDG